MMSKTKFREIGKRSDIHEIERIVRSAKNFKKHEVLVAKELIEDAVKKGKKSDYKFLFCENENGDVLGYACYGEIPCTIGSYDLYWIVVDKKNQGQGIGTKLLLETEKIIFKKGRAIYIETSSKEDYELTKKFYLKQGYKEEARLKDFYEKGDDKLVYVKRK